MSLASVSEKFQVVIPVDVRRALGFVPGARLDVRADGFRATSHRVRKASPIRGVGGHRRLIKAQPSATNLSLLKVDRVQAMRAKNNPARTWRSGAVIRPR